MILLTVAKLTHVPLGTRPHEKTLWFLNGALFFSVSYGVVYWSEQYVPSGLAAILFATFPLMVSLFAHLLRPGEPLRVAVVRVNNPSGQSLADLLVSTLRWNGKTYLLMANSSRGVMKINTENIDKAESIVAPVQDKKGLTYETITGWTGVDQLDQLDARHAIVIRRVEGGSMILESLPLP